MRVRSPLLAQSRLIFFPRGTEMFHFPRCRFLGPILFGPGSHPMTGAGLPHSETSGSKCACHSPELIAAYRVLLRLVMPRHPSCARIRLAEDRNLRHLVTLQFFFPDYAVVKEQPRRSGEIRLLRRRAVRSGFGGRAWSRTRDLVLIRDAL